MKDQVACWAVPGLIVAVTLSCASCGGNDSADLPDVADMVGTYELTAFAVTDNTGTTTQDDVASYSGVMKIYPDNTATQDVVINGSSPGLIDNTIVGRTETALQMESPSCTFWLDYSFDGTTFTTTLPLDVACGLNHFSETDVWTRTSTSVSAILLASPPEAEGSREIGALGSIVGAGDLQ